MSRRRSVVALLLAKRRGGASRLLSRLSERLKLFLADARCGRGGALKRGSAKTSAMHRVSGRLTALGRRAPPRPGRQRGIRSSRRSLSVEGRTLAWEFSKLRGMGANSANASAGVRTTESPPPRGGSRLFWARLCEPPGRGFGTLHADRRSSGEGCRRDVPAASVMRRVPRPRVKKL